MCGIVGFLRPGNDLAPDAEEVAVEMSRQLRHRGPDDAGVWSDAKSGVVLAHRRLSILDLSPAGHQPMVSLCGRYVIVFNGEIYNHLSLRKSLEVEGMAPGWRGHSDTETLLAAFTLWGIERTLQATVGMFALALWDRKSRSLTLARDRVGEKPLYYGWQKGDFLFGSELKALKAHPSFCSSVDRQALALMLRHNCIPAPYSIYDGISKLMPGQFLTVSASAENSDISLDVRPYWSFNDAVSSGISDPFIGTDDEAIGLVKNQLLSSVRSQMLSDVPLGAFLSGGIDSSLIVALMQAQSRHAISTFTIGFDNQDYDEAVYAKAVAAHLGTSHTELYVSPGDALSLIPDIPHIYCEPFSDSSQIPTYLVSRLASEHVKVALSGDGGDELFGGYNRYLTAHSVWRSTHRLPKPARRALSRLLASVSVSGWDKLFATIGKVVPARARLRTPGEKAHKLANVLLADSESSYYRELVSHCRNPASMVRDAVEPPTLLDRTEDWPDTEDFVAWMMALDFQTYLPDDILTKVDRAAMARSLETRVPFLDHHVVELAWRIPRSVKIRDGQGKWLLKQILFKYVPAHLIERPKMGFANPLHDWLRGPLREWAEDLLDRRRLENDGYFFVDPVRSLWADHISGKANNQYALWDVLMFQAWLSEQ